jgi:hypothetical protein
MLLKRTIWKCVVLLTILSAGAIASDSPALTLSEYKTQLDQAISVTDEDNFDAAKISSFATSLPDKWVVSDQGQTYELSLDWLKTGLAKTKDEEDNDLYILHTRLTELRTAAGGFVAPPDASTSERDILNGILSRKEFRGVQSVTWLDRLKARIFQFLFGLVSRLFGSSAFPVVSRILVWSLVAIAVLVLAYMIYRTLKNNARQESVVPAIAPVSAKAWSEWMADARTAAARGDWREAIHLAYWAGISLLEARGLWRPDRARTPREYLRLLPSASEFHPTLKQLTLRFEVIWYGYKTADEQAFQQSLAELEKLGCR